MSNNPIGYYTQTSKWCAKSDYDGIAIANGYRMDTTWLLIILVGPPKLMPAIWYLIDSQVFVLDKINL
jgi:hypothetical protein